MSDLYLFRNTLRDLIRPGKLVAAALLVAVAVLIAVLMRASAGPGHFDPAASYNGISSVLVFGYMVVILSLVFATGVIAQEIEQKTIPYLLTRPMPRWRILLAKYAAAVVVTTATVWLADFVVALTLFGPAKLGASHLWKDILILPVGAMAYSGLFLLLATIVPRALLYGLAYAFVEPLLPMLPGDWQKISLLSYLHALAPHLDAADLDAAGQAAGSSDIAVWLAWTVVAAVIVASVIFALAIFSTREYTPQEERV
jgi:ABC-2 type transport system permease protein